MSYYEFVEPNWNRLNDQEWKQRLEFAPPLRPHWQVATVSPGGLVNPESPFDQEDLDGDGIKNGNEDGRSPGPGNSSAVLMDSDGDRLPDGAEDANRNGQKDVSETSTRDVDTDADGYEDGIESRVLSSDPLQAGSPPGSFADADADALPDSLDPQDGNPDSDGDRLDDGYEAAELGLSAVTDAGDTPLLGDTDHNGQRDNADSQRILNFFGSQMLPDTHPSECDLNRDARIDNADSQWSLNFFSRAQESLPVR
jgi:hypothetical protein